MKRLVDDPTAEGRDLVEALRKRAARLDPALPTSALAAVTKKPAVPRVVKPVVLIGGAATVAAIVVAAVIATRRPAPVRPEPRRVEQLATVVAEPPDLQGAPADLAEAPVPAPKHVHRPVPAPQATQPDAEESRLLLEAYRALRRDNDRSTALARVDEYLRRYPDGALAEEALVVAFDAAGPSLAARYASQYVARFPDGEHIARAKQLASVRIR